MIRPRKIHDPLTGSFEDVLIAIADENKPALQEAIARPFLKWAGGKRSILSELVGRMPVAYGPYYEPFLGGGALFFAVRPEKACLSDINFPLILTFRAVRDDLDGLITALRVHAANHSKEYYMQARRRLGYEKDPTKIAALLVYLNKTCYNGLYRVNQQGIFNVPIGDYDAPTILDEGNLRAGSVALQHAEISHHGFSDTKIEKDGFYYLDPPYHRTFDGYDSSRFGDEDHKRLALFCKELDNAGCQFMVSNSDTAFVRSLYRAFNIDGVQASRFVSCKASTRGKENELIIRNYE